MRQQNISRVTVSSTGVAIKLTALNRCY